MNLLFYVGVFFGGILLAFIFGPALAGLWHQTRRFEHRSELCSLLAKKQLAIAKKEIRKANPF